MPAPFNTSFNTSSFNKTNKKCQHIKEKMIQLWAEYTPNGNGCYQCKFCNRKFIIPHQEKNDKEYH